MVKEEQNEENTTVLKDPGAARYIGMSVSFLRQSRCEGQVGNRTPGPKFIKIGRSIVYRIVDLDKFLEENSQG